MSNFELFLDFQKQVLTYSFMSLNKKRALNESESWFSGAQKKILVECDHFISFLKHQLEFRQRLLLLKAISAHFQRVSEKCEL